ncbi:MAG: hypothetical protein ACI4T1_01860 [Christensenellales bacterium]
MPRHNNINKTIFKFKKEKNKMKNKKSLVALVVMAFMLVASITMAATGAWFTDQATAISGTQLDFGKIVLSGETGTVTAATVKTETTDLLMPGDTLTINFSATNDEQAAYWIADVTVTLTNTTADDTAFAALDGTYGADSKVTTAQTVAAAESISGTIELELTGATYGNDYQGATVTVTVTLKAVQQENLTADEAYALLIA